MSDLIRREDALTIIERLRDRCENDEMAFALNWAAGIIRDTTAADAVEVKHGTWTKTVVAMSRLYDEKGMTENMNGYTCGACKEFSIAKFNFCPNCGARMDGRREDEKDG